MGKTAAVRGAGGRGRLTWPCEEERGVGTPRFLLRGGRPASPLASAQLSCLRYRPYAAFTAPVSTKSQRQTSFVNSLNKQFIAYIPQRNLVSEPAFLYFCT